MARLRLPMRTFCSLVLATLVLFLLVTTPSVLRAQPGGQQPATPAADADGWRTYADTDPLLDYSGQWSTFQVANAFGGTLTGSDDADASLTVRFEGTGIRVLFAKGPEGGDFTGQIDEFWRVYGDALADSYSYGHVMAFEDIEPGTHTLRVVNGKGAIWIEAIQVQGVLVAPFAMPQMEQLVQSDFEDGRLGLWDINKRFETTVVRPQYGNTSLWIPGHLPPISLKTTALHDHVVSFQLLLEAGKAEFGIRRSQTGEYRVSISATGEIAIHRDDVLLGTAATDSLPAKGWVNVQMTVVGKHLSVELSGNTILSVEDPLPLPAGTFVILPDRDSGIRIDDFNLQVAADELANYTVTPAPPIETMSVVPVFPDESVGITTTMAYEDQSIYLQVDGDTFLVEGSVYAHGGAMAWSKDGAYLAVRPAVSANSFDIITPGGMILKRITIANVAFVREPDWSPDGSKIAFSAPAAGKDGTAIYYVDAACSGSCTGVGVTTNQPGDDNHPSWSPDGLSIAFGSDRDRPDPTRGYRDVFITNLAGSSATRVSPVFSATEAWDFPSWAPDRNTIVATYSPDLESVELLPAYLYLFNWLNPSENQQVTFPTDEYDSHFDGDWKPDGQRVAFSRGDIAPQISFVDEDGQNLQASSFIGSSASWESMYQDECQLELVSGQGNGLALRQSPTRYSPRLGFVPWGTAVSAEYRLEVASDIWYQIDVNGVSGWIAAEIGEETYAEAINPSICGLLPKPYDAYVSPRPEGDWESDAQVEKAEIEGCNEESIKEYLRSESEALLLARLAFGEAANYRSVSDLYASSSGGVVFSDAINVAWTVRLNALMGLPNYGDNGEAGSSVEIKGQILRSGAYEPIDDLIRGLVGDDCEVPNLDPQNVGSVRRMVYPENTQEKVELYQLWVIYQEVQAQVLDAEWISMSENLRGFDQFKGVPTGDDCPAGEDGLARPGSGYVWAANQPYPPRPTQAILDADFGLDQERKTCFQDVYHLDDWFWDQVENDPDFLADPATSTFPREPFCVTQLTDPDNLDNYYFLAQLRGLDGNPWPPDISCDPSLLD